MRVLVLEGLHLHLLLLLLETLKMQLLLETLRFRRALIQLGLVLRRLVLQRLLSVQR